MTDHSDLTPAQEQEVRRLLAEARHTEPMPTEVVERLDRVLADLAEEPSRERTVVRLADRRRRAGVMLVAAAAVVVAGVGVGQVVSNIGASSGSDSSAGQAPAAARDSEENSAAGSADEGPAPTQGETRQVTTVRIRPDRFAEDVALLRGRPVASSYSAQDGLSAAKEERHELLDRQTRTTLCTAGDWGRGRYRAVRYGTSVGYLVFRRPTEDSQVVDLFLCGGEDAVRSVTLPRR